MVEIEKSKTETKKKPGENVDAFARLRAQLKGFKAAGVVRKNIYLVLDASGSMGSYCRTKDGQTKSKLLAVKAVVDDVVSTYSSRVGITQIAFADNAEIIAGTADYRTCGGTNIEQGLALLVAANSQAVLLSDGGETDGNARGQIPRLMQDHIVVNTIGVGVDSEGEALLREIANKTGGAYAGIDADVSAIFETFKALVSKAVAALTSGKQAIEGGAG